MLLSLSNVSKSFGNKLILSNIDASINEGDRIGLIGMNGAGKTTLLNVLCRRYHSYEGEVSYKSGLSIGYLEQNTGLDKENSIFNEMRSVFSKLLETEQTLRRLELEMASFERHDTPEYEALTQEYNRLSSYFEVNDGYQINVKINTILNGMGFGETDHNLVISSLSGGEKTRLAMAKLLLEEPELLILDEPTNHLDFHTLTWLETYLSTYRGALLIVSHDRYFLDKTVDHIWEVENHSLHTYRGNYSKYKVLKAERVAYELKEYEKQQLQIAAMQEYAEKNIARASTANSAKSRLHRLAQMEILEKPVTYSKPPSFQFEFSRSPVKDLLQVSGLDLWVGDGASQKCLCKNLEFEIKRGEKVAIIGANGIGKTTLLKTLLGIYPQRNGEIHWGRNVETGYYDQENQQINPQNTVLEELWGRFPSYPEHKIRSILGRVLLTGDNVYKQASVISGGERARLGFAILMTEQKNTLLLDEPTNHLDLQTREALEEALTNFEGTLLFVSHDRYFLNAIPTRILELTEEGLRSYSGNFDFYQEEKLKEQVLSEQDAKPKDAPAPKSAGYRSKKQRSEEVKRRNRLRELEHLVEQAEIQQQAIQAELADPVNASNYQLLQEKCTELETAKRAYEQYFEEWLLLQEEKGE